VAAWFMFRVLDRFSLRCTTLCHLTVGAGGQCPPARSSPSTALYMAQSALKSRTKGRKGGIP
jgi:hypothetical protein